MTNETCRRNGRKCYNEIEPNLNDKQYSAKLEQESPLLFKKLQERIQRIKSIVTYGNQNTDYLLSLGLEDDYSIKASSTLYRLVRSQWDFEIIRNCLYSSCQDFLNLPREFHSAVPVILPSRCLFNQDGLNGGIEQARRLFSVYKGCFGLLAWTRDAQGIKDKFIPPFKRTFVISRKDMVQYGQLLREHRFI